MNSKNKIYIFERIENFGTVEDKDIYRHCDEGTYSVEHIMPQHLTPKWVAVLGDDYEEIHETWLHRLANLTLTGYNSKYSNSIFTDKRDMENGFKQSGLRMNTWIAQQEEWTLDEIKTRNDMLMQQALAIWSQPETDYKPAEKQLDSCTLDDDVDLSGREIVRFEYKNTEQPVTSWITMLEQVLIMLHSEDASVLSVLAHTTDPEDELSIYVSDNPAELRGSLQIDEDIYIERNTSTTTKISMLRKFFKAYGQNPEDLVFYLRDINEDDNADETGTRHELRRRYWKFALDYIHAAHENGGTFQNVNTSKMNWISGFFGVSGFNISCVANYGEARVEVAFAKYDTTRNKAAYDYVFGFKDEIEKELGIPLKWWRLDEKKSSYIATVLEGVSIADETDWIKMAKFHAEWSRKFFDVIIPYVRDWAHK